MNAEESQRPLRLKRHLPRLDPEAYRGEKHVSFTATVLRRQHLFTSHEVVDASIAALREQCQSHERECLVYCFMPDHVHMIMHGLCQRSDSLEAHNDWKGATGKVLAHHYPGSQHWQPQSYDHVLRSYEYERGALRNMIRYILQNPVRAGLVAEWQEYPFLGSLIGPCDIREEAWWDWFYE